MTMKSFEMTMRFERKDLRKTQELQISYLKLIWNFYFETEDAIFTSDEVIATLRQAPRKTGAGR